MPWIDHVRTLVIVLVVNMHACVTYSHVGSWYIMSEQEPSLPAKIPFVLWQAHLQSFFMGLLFFVAGYFAHGSLARRGAASFVRERWVRLGLPTFLYMLAIHPFILLGLNPWKTHFPSVPTFYGKFLRSGHFLSASGPMWFALALLLFCLGLITWRALCPLTSISPGATSTGLVNPPSARNLCLFALGLGLGSFVVRLAQPIGTNILNMQICFFVQYIAAFTVGVRAARDGWLLNLAASKRALRAGQIALIASPLVLLALIGAGIKDGPETFSGGWHWQALGLAIWEQFTGIGLSLGLLAWFWTHSNRDTRMLRWLADRSFGVYWLHPPVLVALMMLYRRLPQNPFVLAALLTVTGLLASFALADCARRTPGLKNII